MSEFSYLVGEFEGFVQGYGVLAVTVILLLEAIGFPVPGESLLIFSALMASRHEMSLPRRRRHRLSTDRVWKNSSELLPVDFLWLYAGLRPH